MKDVARSFAVLGVTLPVRVIKRALYDGDDEPLLVVKSELGYDADLFLAEFLAAAINAAGKPLPGDGEVGR